MKIIKTVLMGVVSLVAVQAVAAENAEFVNVRVHNNYYSIVTLKTFAPQEYYVHGLKPKGTISRNGGHINFTYTAQPTTKTHNYKKYMLSPFVTYYVKEGLGEGKGCQFNYSTLIDNNKCKASASQVNATKCSYCADLSSYNAETNSCNIVFLMTGNCPTPD